MTTVTSGQRARIPGERIAPEVLAELRDLAARAGADLDRGASRWFGVTADALTAPEADELAEALRKRVVPTPPTPPAREVMPAGHGRIPRRPGPAATEGQRRFVARLLRDGAVDVADWLARLGCQLHEMTRPEAGELIDTCLLVARHEELI